ncbi:hypothetical protein [Herbaspirillum sp. GW103]|uniref:hypothetical protein n=1 Tax=Herbaspirillum sp. GW103 TaxID=1175306 RepID=UPI000555E097|nr:hypothetical protein [Herbaspirillum sp. GW103]
MSDILLKAIVERYTLALRDFEKTGAREKVSGDLMRSQVRKCLTEMYMVGATPDDIRAAFGDLEKCSLQDNASVDPNFFRVLTAMKLHVEFLLFLEEHRKLDTSSSRKRNDDFGFH